MEIPYYQEYGTSQDALLLLHSGGLHSGEWQGHWAKLGAHFRLICPDLPGHGKTLLPADHGLTVEYIAQSVLNLLDHLALERVHVCGSSLGGAVALWLAVHHPERLRHCIVYRMSYRKTEIGYQETRKIATPEYWRGYGLEAWMSKIHTPQGGNEAWKEVIARVARVLLPGESAYQISLQDLSSIQSPVLLIAGDRDPIAPLQDLFTMQCNIPQAALWLIPNASHITACNTWRRDIFDSEVLNFLRT